MHSNTLQRCCFFFRFNDPWLLQPLNDIAHNDVFSHLGNLVQCICKVFDSPDIVVGEPGDHLAPLGLSDASTLVDFLTANRGSILQLRGPAAATCASTLHDVRR